MVTRWKEVLGSLEAANILMDIHTCLEDAEKAGSEYRFMEAAQHLAKVSEKSLKTMHC